MKKRIGISLVVMAAALGCWVMVSGPKPAIAPTAFPNEVPPTATLTDETEVFQKAFWKRPTENDKILHAERREWADAAGIKKWQWFLEVEPSPALVKYLREDDAFGLTPALAQPTVPSVPAWFKFDPRDMEALQAPMGGLRLYFSKTQGKLYATDTGGGFRPGATVSTTTPEPSDPVSTGRLAPTSPPQPQQP